MEFKEIYMDRCLQLARNGVQNTAPNPMVGAVLVWNDQIIGEGYHVRCGEPHAEVNAIASVKNPDLLKESTLYVSLEPCAHYGKTPPCADLIISKGIPRVVIGCLDPFAQVSGRGIQKLKEAGIEVIVGVKEKECLELNKKFITYHQKKRPFITLKWAESADSFLDIQRSKEEKAFRFSTPESTALVHKRRSEHQAILIGGATAIKDNPTLNVRFWDGPAPLRLVIDTKGELPQTLKLLSDGVQSTRIYTYNKAFNSAHLPENVSIVTLSTDKNKMKQIMEDLYQLKVLSLLVEGGTKTLNELIEEELWDEIYIEHTTQLLHKGVPAPSLPQNEHTSMHTFHNQTIIKIKRKA